MPLTTTYLVETFLTLVAVSLLAVVLLVGARRIGVGRPSGPLRVVGHVPLDARRSIYAVRVGAQVIVVGASEAGLTKLAEMPPEGFPSDGEPGGGAFSRVLARVRGTP